MLLNKTPRAHAALKERSDSLSAFERRVLIICDGQRSLDDLRGLLGAPAPRAVERLVSEGYLIGVSAPRGGLGAALSALRGTRQAASRTALSANRLTSTTSVVAGAGPASSEASAAPACQAPDAGTPASHDGPPPPRRRSVVAAKMYVIGLLQLQRNPDAVAQAAVLQTCRDPEAIMIAIAEALDCIAGTCNASYTRRVIERLEEITPEALLGFLEPQSSHALTANA